MSAKKSYLPLYLLLLSTLVFGQPSRTVKVLGRVVEMVNGKYVGISNIKVAVPGQDDDLTKDDGTFELNLLPGAESATFILPNSPLHLISPAKGELNLPPYEGVQIVLCKRENERLLAKAKKLEQELARLKKEGRINEQRLRALGKALSDTSLFFEKKLWEAEALLKKTEESANVVNQELRRQLALREREVDSLVAVIQQLEVERFLRQQVRYDRIARELNNYRSVLEDFRKNLGLYAPDCASGMFPQACTELEKLSVRYSQARDTLFANHEGHLAAVRGLWSEALPAEELESLYTLVFKQIHEPLLFGHYNDHIAEPIRKGAPKPKIKKACGELLTQLAPLALDLQNRTDATLKLLNKHF